MSAPTLSRPEPRIRPRPEPLARPATRPASRRLVALGLIVVVALFTARALHAARTMSITGDEATYLTHLLHFWMTGDDLGMWELGAPRLPHALNALPSYLSLRRTDWLPADADPRAIEALVLSGSTRVLWPARVVTVGSGVLLLLGCFGAVARASGAWAGLAAAGLLSLVPEVVAHSAIAGCDMPFTAAAFPAVLLLGRYAERPSPRRWLAVGLAIGLAWAMRHSALLLLILAAGVHAWVQLRKVRAPGAGALVERLVGSVAASVVLGVVSFTILWAGDGFETIRVADLAERATSLSVPERVGPVDIGRVPVPTSLLSVLKQVRHQNKGHEAYFCGEVREQGWPQYFPVAFLLKTPVGLVALLVLAAALVRPRGALDRVCLACLALLWVMLVRNRVNIGVRYALLTYPLAMPFVARLFRPEALRDRVWGPITLAAGLWFGGAALACHPHYLSYFNPIGGGPGQGWLYLADSNVDWGQDFDRLGPVLRRRQIDEVTVDISTERRLSLPGVVAVANPSRAMHVPAVTPPHRRLYDADGGYLPVYTRYVAVSVSRLLGLYSQNDMSWLRTRRLVERVGDSVFLFDMDRPADRPLAP